MYCMKKFLLYVHVGKIRDKSAPLSITTGVSYFDVLSELSRKLSLLKKKFLLNRLRISPLSRLFSASLSLVSAL